MDVVYTYVNSNDLELNRMRQFYSDLLKPAEQPYSNGPVRYRDNGELRFSIESARRHLPFLNHIYVACAGSPPDWLKTTDTLTIVDQNSLLPPGAGPNFQSDVIECFLHRIPGLSESYLYSNDDFFFARNHRVEDFFAPNGTALVGLSERFAGQMLARGPFRQLEMNSVRALVRHSLAGNAIAVRGNRPIFGIDHPRQRLRGAINGLPLLNTPSHVTQPYRKSVWEGFHSTFAQEIAALCQTRFRSSKGIATNFMFHHYARSVGAALFYYDPSHVFVDRQRGAPIREQFWEALLSNTSQISRFCLNDGETDGHDGWEEYIQAVFKRLGYDCTPITR